MSITVIISIVFINSKYILILIISAPSTGRQEVHMACKKSTSEVTKISLCGDVGPSLTFCENRKLGYRLKLGKCGNVLWSPSHIALSSLCIVLVHCDHFTRLFFSVDDLANNILRHLFLSGEFENRQCVIDLM